MPAPPQRAPFLPRTGTPYIPRPHLALSVVPNATTPLTAVDITVQSLLNGTDTHGHTNDIVIRLTNVRGFLISERRVVDSAETGTIIAVNFPVAVGGTYNVHVHSRVGQSGSKFYVHTGA